MPYWISYYRPSLDGEKLQKYLMPTLLETLYFARRTKRTYSDEWHYNYERLAKIEDMVLKGHAIIQLNQQDQNVCLQTLQLIIIVHQPLL